MPKTYCIICGNQKKGIPVEDDFVLDLIRWFKRNVTKNEQGNRLVVCRECYQKYSAGRRRFESRQRRYLVLGILFLLVSVLLSQQLSTLIVSLFVVALLYAFSFLSYMPKINIKKAT